MYRTIAKIATVSFVALALLLLAPMTVAADRLFLPRVSPVDPVVMAQGGSFVAVTNGYQSLFTNPAGMRHERGSLTLVSTTAWIHARPDVLLDDRESFSLQDLGTLLPILQHQYAGGISDDGSSYSPNGAVGLGASTGIGWSGGGLGLGLSAVAEVITTGSNVPFGITGEMQGGFDFVGGVAFPVTLLGWEFALGADVRPIVRLYAPLASADVGRVLSSLLDTDPSVVTALSSVPTLNGYGLAVDLGTIASRGPISVGLSIRDLFGTRVGFARHPFSTVLSSLQDGGLPGISAESEVVNDYRIPMEVSLGAAYHPDLGPIQLLIDPVVHAEVKDIGAIVRENASLWSTLHIGAELRVLRYLRLRSGLNQGYFTFGAGVKLLFAEVNAAVYTQELGSYAGDIPSSGISVEAAIRF